MKVHGRESLEVGRSNIQHQYIILRTWHLAIESIMIHHKENRVPLPASGPLSYLYPTAFGCRPLPEWSWPWPISKVELKLSFDTRCAKSHIRDPSPWQQALNLDG